MHQKQPPAKVATARRGAGAAERRERAARRRRMRFMFRVD
jgi:hypothetical protein